jgi:hypothetical protein
MAMTHDELLDAIDRQIVTAPPFALGGYTRFLQALRAVVELHKPEWVLPQIILRDTKPEPIAICTHCSDEQWRKSYPCPTIQAIEKELNSGD